MGYEYLDDGVTSDLTFEARGASLPELFRAAADATTNVMVESLEAIRPSVTRPVSVTAESLDLLLLRFLDEIVFAKDAHALLLRAAEVRVEGANDAYRLEGTLAGEPIDPARHPLASDVKAVTLHGLSVVCDQGVWRARVTLDV